MLFQYRLFITFTDFPNGGGKGSDLNGNGDLSTDDRKDTGDLGLEVVQQISTAAGLYYK